jgi:ComF family protein
VPLLVDIKEALLHWIYPHTCAGCGTDLAKHNSSICIRCLSSMPVTSYANWNGNPVERIFWGRLPILSAACAYHFAASTIMQELLHECKYQKNKDLTIQLGRLMGEQLINNVRFTVDFLVPLPLHKSREKKRGYNQAELLCRGMAEVLSIPVKSNLIKRVEPTKTQTSKSRIERWENMKGKFVLTHNQVTNAHILLVDDVITTGATLEACGQVLLEQKGVQLSIFALCYASS